MRGKYGLSVDPDCYSGSTVLKNKLNIRNQDTLDEVEAELSYIAAEYVRYEDDIKFDSNLLTNIHYLLFSELYTWAGKFRTVDISKGTTRFCNAGFIETSIEHLFKNIPTEEDLESFDRETFIAAIADLYCELNVIHPFRDGNGRTMRMFLELYCAQVGIGLDWSTITRDELVSACIAGYGGNLDPLTDVFSSVVSRYDYKVKYMPHELYEEDFYSWSLHQAKLLKAEKLDELDTENIFEEIMDGANRCIDNMENHVVTLLSHLLKWKHCQEYRIGSYRASIVNARVKINRLLRKNPGLKSEIGQVYGPDQFADSYKIVSAETGLSEESLVLDKLWSFEEVMDNDFWPETSNGKK